MKMNRYSGVGRFLPQRCLEIENLKLKSKIETFEKGRSTLTQKENSIDNLLHEIRIINRDLKLSLDSMDFENMPDEILNIWAQSNLLSIRIRSYEFESNPNSIGNLSMFEIPIFKRIDKVSRCIRAARRDKKTHIYLSGESYHTFRTNDIIEIAFYIILENAVKYAEEGTDISINFTTQRNDLLVTFQNKGLIPDNSELKNLRTRGYRGSNSTNVTGNGIGLYTLQNICSALEIDLGVSCKNDNSEIANHGTFQIQLTFHNVKDGKQTKIDLEKNCSRPRNIMGKRH